MVVFEAKTSERLHNLTHGHFLPHLFNLPVLWITVAIIAVGSVPSARANHIHMHGGPFIGVVLGVTIDPVNPSTAFVVAHGGGVFRSKNSGATWLALNQGLPNRQVFSLVQDPRNRGKLYLGTDDGLFLSDNEGAAWRPLAGALAKRNIRSLVFDPQGERNLYVATDQGVFAGKNNQWARFKAGLPYDDVRVVVADSQGEIIAGAFGGVYRLIKSKNRWQEIGTGLSDRRIRALAIEPSSPSVIYAGTATNGGQNWQSFNRGLLNSTVMSLLYVPSAEPNLYVGTVDGIFESKNGSIPWQSIGPDLPFTVSVIAYNPKQPGQLYAGSGGRLYFSQDAGKTWRENSGEINYFSTVSHSAKR